MNNSPQLPDGFVGASVYLADAGRDAHNVFLFSYSKIISGRFKTSCIDNLRLGAAALGYDLVPRLEGNDARSP